MIALWKTDRTIVFRNPEEAKSKIEQLGANPEKIKNSIKQIAEGEYKNDKEIPEENIVRDTMDYFFNKENVKGVRLAMLSTILRFYYPNLFPIIDVRAHRSSWYLYFADNEHEKIYKNYYSGRKDGKGFNDEETKRLKPIRINENNRIIEYCRYIERCNAINADNRFINYSEIDKYLYQIDADTKMEIDSNLIQ